MKSYTYCAIAIFSVVTLCGITTISAQSPPSRARTLDLRALNISYNASNLSDSIFMSPFDYSTDRADGVNLTFPTGVQCEAGTGFLNYKRSYNHTNNVQVDTGVESCGMLYNKAYSYANNSLSQKCYDTSKKYVEMCPNDRNITFAFGMMSNAISQINANMEPLRSRYLAWLESVLYLNTQNPEYFCACVEAIEGELPLPPDTAAEYGFMAQNIGLAVDQWLILHTSCDTPALWHQYLQTRKSQWDYYDQQDPAWKLTHPMDTTLPSMHQLGLDTLLAKHFQFSVSPGKPFATIIPSYSVTQNPTDGATELRFTLGSDAYVNVEVHDVLGRLVSGDAVGKILSVGDHRVPIDISNYPAGTYYLSITLGTGEVRTVKLVKK